MLPYIVTVRHPVCGTDVIRVTAISARSAAERAQWLAYERHGRCESPWLLSSFFAASVEVDTQSCIG